MNLSKQVGLVKGPTLADASWERGISVLPGAVRRTYAANATIAGEYHTKSSILIMIAGWAAFAKTLPNGSRLIVDFALPREIAVIEFAGKAGDTVTALSDVIAIELAGPVRTCSARYPQSICEAILRAEADRYSRVAEHLASVSRRGAVERTAHFLLELACRSHRSATSYPARFECPLTQGELADALGLSAVHVSRVLKTLRQTALASFRYGVIELHDLPGLIKTAGFDRSYISS
ncbi:Crp/Fnr family transcriptional regulator [Mesorhizobium sp. M1A.F.Ca.IN.020.06.1.1]|uniref:Crp/Fnr family transcriptional regulator n=1 Tax=unclassified Mesorhizobium TaxID=325217 RepID=UPI000BAFD810|nr:MULTISPECIES: Crp/Fnr family transcriptional regulator [unclassified Mesorhizobium]PBB31909.1 Crp/Fnr family transcriptional regulator [Mesorhizobium sp. WSM3882]RUV08432.1 Crp/Fnr family transcriptional regulator [Mesorhizobium sp. M1A.F.Ca.IN.020.03.2.1]RUW14802.1 Crp/Fnr family transcriptional regulator [Mesorhizobium sp. M1A.F.Ca.IN.022.05.2.1]RUW37455.1 Crp/Fnr family transcriptional regulator [Mesorhizobium sp. M1A.F.Ca.IN.020.06.1.1]RUV89784.1 Crp/Fnr family transcriptional regulator